MLELKEKLKFDEMFCVEADGFSGGLALFWNREIVLKANQNFIHIVFYEKNGGSFWDGTFVYGNPNFQERRYLWDKL